ncbi:unnamed protein product [Psylliodes chrysocephalus]|uniref:Uncharacterized protein n=1 Tax=Psylliodes chrysocephalus TaxID=3402493 RepID=A0A9P0DA74_9CUCU|nr:unnamed protein product [Psylliodes chrysocephala]
MITVKDIDEDKVSKLALNKAGLDFKIVGKFQLRLAIFGVPVEFEAEDLKEGVLNELELDQDKLTIKHKFGPKGQHFNHWVVEVSAKNRATLLTNERVIDANEGFSVDTDKNSCDSDTLICSKGSGHKKYHFDTRQNEIPGTSSARNLDSPSKTDGTSQKVEMICQSTMMFKEQNPPEKEKLTRKTERKI